LPDFIVTLRALPDPAGFDPAGCLRPLPPCPAPEVPKEKKTVEPLPKTLPGAVCAQWVRCGKPNCRCARGRPHGPYFYRFWREGAQLRKRYVRPPELERVRGQCRARRETRREVIEWYEVWQQMVAQVREVEQR
jgi:hypothetical protein